VDVNLGSPIAYGRTAEIYAWREGFILKLFYDWFGLHNIKIEARNTRAAHAAGLPVPEVGNIIQIAERCGLEYERIIGQSMFKMIQHKPWTMVPIMRRCAELHARLHGANVPVDLPILRHELEKNINRAQALPVDLRHKVLASLEAMPGGEQLCHGDFWPANIIITGNGDYIIDWFRATRGNPLADLARTTNLVFGFTRTRQVKRQFLSYGSSRLNQLENSVLQLLTKLFYPIYINTYFKLRPGDKKEYRRWLPIMAAARLADNIPELEEMLIAQVELIE